MKKITFCIVLFALLLLSSCANLFSPPYDPILEGTWEGSTEIKTTVVHKDPILEEITYTVVTTEATTEKYTFYNGNKVKRESSWSKEVTSNGALISAPSSNDNYIYEWKNLRDNYDIDLSNIDTGKITINGFELTRNK